MYIMFIIRFLLGFIFRPAKLTESRPNVAMLAGDELAPRLDPTRKPHLEKEMIRWLAGVRFQDELQYPHEGRQHGYNLIDVLQRAYPVDRDDIVVLGVITYGGVAFKPTDNHHRYFKRLHALGVDYARTAKLSCPLTGKNLQVKYRGVSGAGPGFAMDNTQEYLREIIDPDSTGNEVPEADLYSVLATIPEEKPNRVVALHPRNVVVGQGDLGTRNDAMMILGQFAEVTSGGGGTNDEADNSFLRIQLHNRVGVLGPWVQLVNLLDHRISGSACWRAGLAWGTRVFDWWDERRRLQHFGIGTIRGWEHNCFTRTSIDRDPEFAAQTVFEGRRQVFEATLQQQVVYQGVIRKAVAKVASMSRSELDSHLVVEHPVSC